MSHFSTRPVFIIDCLFCIAVSPHYLLFKNELKIAVKVNPFRFLKALGWIDAMGSR
jgi:hypothetical protein